MERVETEKENARDQSREVARIAAFSDGVFSIAITLLALQLAIPVGTNVDVWAELVELRWNFLSFVISFLVIGTYWISHHHLFAVVRRYDRRLLWLNLLSLFFIILMPFTTSLVGEYGSQPVAVAAYALSLAGAGFASTGLAAYALVGHRLCVATVDDREIRFSIWRGLVIALIFLGSLALLPLGTSVTQLSWLSIMVAERIVWMRLARPDEV